MVSPITILPLDFSPEDAYITGGKFATKHVPVNLRRLVVAESASNDGLAYPFLTISLYLSTESYRSAFRDWFLIGWLCASCPRPSGTRWDTLTDALFD